jgi:pyridoxamine 5'-phosphate oxidase
MSLSDWRRDYDRNTLRKQDLDADPLRQLQRWLGDAQQAGMIEPNAMTLATASPEGVPAARMVLLKGLDAGGLVFFTNYKSSKANDLETNPRAALVFHWDKLERQVRVTGSVSRVSREESETYFRTRPAQSQIAAWVAPQSQVVPSREFLEERFAELARQYEGKAVPLPEGWGGYRVVPETVEFWQGRPNRLHDRLRYRRDQDGRWIIERIAP